MSQPIAIISKEFPNVVIPLIKKAKHSIDIVVYDWRFYMDDPTNPVTKFSISIFEKARSGVSVRCLVNNETIKDILRKQKCQAYVMDTSKILHTKLIIIDKKVIIIGSHNYTQNAFTSNFEASTMFELDNENNDFVKYFNNLWGV